MALSTEPVLAPFERPRRSVVTPIQRDPLVAAIERRLGGALAMAREIFGADDDPYRGLFVDGTDLERGTIGAPLYPPRSAAEIEALGGASPALVQLGGRLGLDVTDRALLLLSVAPDLDERIARVYAYLQDHVGRRRASVGLLLDLIASDAGERARLRDRFALEAPLLRSGAVTLTADRAGIAAGLLDLDVVPAPCAVAALLGGSGVDPRLSRFLRTEPPGPDTRLSPAERRELRAAWVRDPGARVHLETELPHGWRADAGRIAAALGRPMLTVDTSVLLEADIVEGEAALGALLLHARAHGAVLHLPVPALTADSRRGPRLTRLLRRLGTYDGALLLTGPRAAGLADQVLGLLVVEPRDTTFDARATAWRHTLRRHDIGADEALVTALADRFRHTGPAIDDTVRNAVHAAGTAARVDTSVLFAAARARSDGTVGADATRLEATVGWDDLVVAPDVSAQLREMCQRVRHRRRVLDDWGLGRGEAADRGVAALFSGPSGTGKTMSARVVARDLGLDVYRVDLSRVVSKYIGETEKNLGRVFDAAEDSNAILFFDEADALFGKRSEVSDAHDRYANIEVGYLLQRMEVFAGITILATNLRSNMDEAFVRRLDFHVPFTLPDASERRSLWAGMLPDSCPRDESVDIDFLAESFALSGGNIRNAAFAAAFLAADEGSAVGMRHLVRGVRREFQKMGKVCVASDFGPWYEVIASAAGSRR